MIYQAIKHYTLRNDLKKHGIPNATFAAALERSDTLISLILSGEKGMSHELQQDVFRFFDFVEELEEENSAPVDFRKVELILPLWRKWKAKRAESEVIRSAREREQRSGEAETT